MFRVLIADDHPIVRRGLKQILEDAGNIRSVDEAESGQEVLDKISKNNFDVILLDISMPGMNGLECLKAA